MLFGICEQVKRPPTPEEPSSRRGVLHQPFSTYAVSDPADCIQHDRKETSACFRHGAGPEAKVPRDSTWKTPGARSKVRCYYIAECLFTYKIYIDISTLESSLWMESWEMVTLVEYENLNCFGDVLLHLTLHSSVRSSRVGLFKTSCLFSKKSLYGEIK